APTASTASSIAGDSTLARPMTATSDTTSAARLTNAVRFDGGAAWAVSAPCGRSGGTKKSRWSTVCTKTKSAYVVTDATPANASCVAENVGPGELVVNVGRTRQSVASVTTVANAAAVPSALNVAVRRRSVETTRHRPTTPLHVIIAAANTVSRASVSVSEPPEAMSATISPTSMTVTATARTSDPSGSPTRWATTSAWWTDARTAPARNAATRASTTSPGLRPHVAASARTATPETTRAH